MTFQIRKSHIDALDYDFEAEVRNHIAALEKHRFAGDSAPISTPEIEASIRRVQYPIEDEKPDDFVADYRIIDDTPPPPTLEERKTSALAELRRQEQIEIDALIAPEKRRLNNILFARALKTDPKTPADAKIIADRQALDAKIDEIALKYAEREAAIADMQ